MRFATVALLLSAPLTAGCLSGGPSSPAVSENDAPDASPTSALDLDGIVWLPVAFGFEPAVTDVPMDVNGTPGPVTFRFHLGWTVPGPVPPVASAMVNVLDPQGTPAGDAMMPPGGPSDAAVRLHSMGPGRWLLRFETMGASDGGSQGAFVEYHIEEEGEA